MFTESVPPAAPDNVVPFTAPTPTEMAAGRYAIRQGVEAEQRKIAIGTANLTGKSAQICADLDFGRSADKAAEKFGVSKSTVDNAVAVIIKGSDELKGAVERGDVAVSTGAVIATLPAAEQDEIVARGFPVGW